MAPQSPYTNPFSNALDFLDPFTAAMAQPPLATGQRMGAGMGGAGNLNIAGLVGVTDPMMSLVLNSVMGNVLTSSLGNNFIPAQYAPTTNLYSQMAARNSFGAFRSSVGQAATKDAPLIYEYMRGAARITGSEFGPREQEAARSFAASAATNIFPNVPTGFLEAIGGSTGTATAMAQNMYLGSRYATDPVTGRRGMSAESTAEITGRVFENLYGKGKDVTEMGGVTAGQAGALYDELQRRGQMGGAMPRAKAMDKIAKDMNMTIAEISAMPELDTKLRELDADRISGRLKEMSKAVSAMKEIFGEMGQPDAPMQQVVGAIEALTQANLPSSDPAKVERMIRDTSNTAKAAGIEMPQMFKLMGATAAMSDRAGLDRIFAPEITNKAVLENEASKRIFGGAKAFGLSSFDKLINVSQQLGVEATKDPRTQQLAAVARLVDQYKFKPEAGSELERVYDIVSGKKQATEEEKKNLLNISQRPGGMAEFLRSQKVSSATIQDVLGNPAANAEYMHKYDIGGKFGRTMQTERVVRGMSASSSYLVERYGKDKDSGASEKLRNELTSNSKDISYIASSALMNASKEELNNPEEVVKKALESHLKSKGLSNLNEKDQQVINSMAAGLTDNAKTYAQRSKFGSLSNMIVTLSPQAIREAQISQAQVSQESQFQETLRGIGKTNVTQRVADLIRNAGPNTTLAEGVASILGSQNKDVVNNLLGGDIEKLDKASKLYANFDPEKVRDDYLRNAAIENKINQDKATTPEEKEKYAKEREEIKDQMKKAGYGSSSEELDKRFNEFADYKKNKEFDNQKTADEAKAKASENLKGMEEKYGVTAEDIKRYNAKELTIVGRGRALADMRKIADTGKLGVLDRFGNAVAGSTPYADLNAAYNDLTSTNKKDISYGLDSLSSFVDSYLRSPQMQDKGREEGLNLVNKAKDVKNLTDKLSTGLGTSLSDILEGKAPESNFNVGYLKEIRGEDERFIDTLIDEKQAPTARKNIENNIEKLNKDTVDNPANKARNDARIKELETLRDTKTEDLAAKKSETQRTIRDLDNNQVEAIRNEYERFEKSRQNKEKADSELGKLIDKVGKGSGLTEGNVEQYFNKRLSGDETKELLGSAYGDKDLRAETLKKSGAENIDQYRQAQNIRSTQENKVKELEGYIKEGDKISEDNKKKKIEVMSSLGLKNDEEAKKILNIKVDEDNTKKLLGFRAAGLTSEQKVKMEGLLGKAGFGKDEIEKFMMTEDTREAVLAKVPTEKKSEIIKALSDRSSAREGLEKGIQELGARAPEALQSILGKDKIKNLVGTAANIAKDLTTRLGSQLADPSGAALSEERKKDIRKSFSLQSDRKALDKYLGDTGLASAARGKDVKAAAIVAGKLNEAASEAARTQEGGSKKDDKERVAILRDLFYKDEKALTEKEKSALTKATGLGFTKDMFKKEGVGEGIFSTDKVSGMFAETSKKLADGKMLGSKSEKVVIASFQKGTELIAKGTLNLKGETNMTLTPGLPASSTSV